MSPRWNPNPDIRTGRHAVYNLHVHLVFVTKYRRKAMTDAMLTRCEEIMREVCENFEAELKQFNGEDDHVHLLVHYPPLDGQLQQVGLGLHEHCGPGEAPSTRSAAEVGGHGVGEGDDLGAIPSHSARARWPLVLGPVVGVARR